MTRKEQYAYNFKILLIGNSGVGKSSLLLRFSDDKFQSNLLNTIGVDFKTKIVEVDRQKVRLMLWDTAGQQRFRTITNAYYRSANGVVIVYDITDRESFNNVVNWYNEMNKNIDQKVACLLVGNKLDMSAKREVKFQEGFNLANRYQLPFIETSAKTCENVVEMFDDLTKKMMKVNGKTNNRPLVPFQPLKETEEPYCKCCGN